MGDDFFTNVVTASVGPDTDLSVLGDLQHLEYLQLTRITDAHDPTGRFFLAGHSFDDPAWVRLGKLTQLRRLDLSNLWITGAGLAHIKDLTHLRYLDLSNNEAITDAGLVYLEQMTQLEELYLNHSGRISDAGLERLKGLTYLKLLNTWNTSVSDEGIAKLKAALPNCKIENGFD